MHVTAPSVDMLANTLHAKGGLLYEYQHTPLIGPIEWLVNQFRN